MVAWAKPSNRLQKPMETCKNKGIYTSVYCLATEPLQGSNCLAPRFLCRLSDLVIGAPLYSVVSDEGKAYVYVSNAKVRCGNRFLPAPKKSLVI